MSFYARAGLGNTNAALAAEATDNTDARSNVWEDLVNDRDKTDGAYSHKSRHSMPFDAGDLAANVADVLVTSAILDTALDVPGSGLNFGDALGLGDAVDAGEGVKAAAGLGAGVFGTLFGA